MAGGTGKEPGAASLLLSLSLGAAAQIDSPAPLRAQQVIVPPHARTIIFEATNAYRAEHDLPRLHLSPTTSKVARDYAKYLAENDKVGHRADGGSARDRLRAQGIEVCHVWENWHKSWTSEERVTVEEAMAKAMNFWKRSPGHARSMRSNAREIGIGVIGWKHGARWIYTEVQIFIDRSCLKGRPKGSPFPKRVLP